MVEKNWKVTMMIDHDMDQTDRVTETLRWMAAEMNFRREQTGMEHDKDGCHYQCEGEDGHCGWEGVCPHDRRGEKRWLRCQDEHA